MAAAARVGGAGAEPRVLPAVLAAAGAAAAAALRVARPTGAAAAASPRAPVCACACLALRRVKTSSTAPLTAGTGAAAAGARAGVFSLACLALSAFPPCRPTWSLLAATQAGVRARVARGGGASSPDDDVHDDASPEPLRSSPSSALSSSLELLSLPLLLSELDASRPRAWLRVRLWPAIGVVVAAAPVA